ncbi:hypothetical protein D3C76_1827270 [compost metagenome]
MRDWFKRRFSLFFREGTFELSFIWDRNNNETLKETIKHYDAVKVEEVGSFR